MLYTRSEGRKSGDDLPIFVKMRPENGGCATSRVIDSVLSCIINSRFLYMLGFRVSKMAKLFARNATRPKQNIVGKLQESTGIQR